MSFAVLMPGIEWRGHEYGWTGDAVHGEHWAWAWSWDEVWCWSDRWWTERQ